VIGVDDRVLCVTPFEEVAAAHPVAMEFFEEMGLPLPPAGMSAEVLFSSLDEFVLSDCGMGSDQLCEAFTAFVSRVEAVTERAARRVGSLTLLGGHDKFGEAEELDLTVRAGEVACVVGPTGSGKSRLLEDIEYLAQGDTPTGRRVLVDGAVPCDEERFSAECHLVAQLSQGMNFVMDLAVQEFLTLHAQSRLGDATDVGELVAHTVACANELTGERFGPETSLTQLSGGQSRALMIADVALVGTAPVVLVDEIENAGVDRGRALDLLTGSDKIVFVVTHDPLIALSGDYRLAVAGGAIRRVVRSGDAERANAAVLRRIDGVLAALRDRVRAGETVEEDIARDVRGVLG
jgi:ABC-type lipoprotein export system ATPase subunit